MSTLIRADEVPAADRLDFVRELTAATWVPMECRAERAAAYWGQFRTSGLGSMQVVVMDVMPITVVAHAGSTKCGSGSPHARADLPGRSGHAQDAGGLRLQLLGG